MLVSLTPSIVFVMMVCRETPQLVSYCLQGLQAAYPDAPKIVIFDGTIPERGYFHALRDKCLIVLGAQLNKGIKEHGCAFWTRFFTLGLSFGTDHLVKLDPDTRVHKPLTLYPPKHGLFSSGSLMSEGYQAQHIQGGFQIFNRDFAGACLQESRDPRYCDHEYWKCGQSQEAFASRDLVSSDYTLRAMTLRINGVMLKHPEMDCRSLPGTKPFDPDAAVTHPHKTPPA
jgi:hypothetical protein